jgi:hypothetical protein
VDWKAAKPSGNVEDRRWPFTNEPYTREGTYRVGLTEMEKALERKASKAHWALVGKHPPQGLMDLAGSLAHGGSAEISGLPDAARESNDTFRPDPFSGKAPAMQAIRDGLMGRFYQSGRSPPWEADLMPKKAK